MEKLGTKTKEKLPAEKILDGHDMNQDIYFLMGYIHRHGEIDKEENNAFPSEHLSEIGELFLRKYKAGEQRSPKRMANDAHAIKRLVEEHKHLQRRYSEDREKLDLHEHYKNIIQGLGDRGSKICGSDKSDAIYHVEQIALSMEMEAHEIMKKPESFDDIPDQWNTGSTLMQRES